jgi:hypothetical protein
MTVTQFWTFGPKWPPWPPTRVRRVSICSEFKQIPACTVLMPNNVISGELSYDKAKSHTNRHSQQLGVTGLCTVHTGGQCRRSPSTLTIFIVYSAHPARTCLCQSIFFTSSMQRMHNAIRELQVWNQLMVNCLNTPPRPNWGHPLHTFLWPGTQTPPFFDSLIYQWIAFNFRNSKYQYVIYISIDTWPSEISWLGWNAVEAVETRLRFFQSTRDANKL